MRLNDGEWRAETNGWVGFISFPHLPIQITDSSSLAVQIYNLLDSLSTSPVCDNALTIMSNIDIQPRDWPQEEQRFILKYYIDCLQ